MGKSSQKIGQVFEKSIEIGADEHGIQLIKIDPVKSGKINTKSKWLDWIGWLKDGTGRALTMDAKWIGDDATFQRSRLTKKQQTYLDQAHADGLLSFVLVGCIVDGRPAQACILWSAMPERGSVPVCDYIVQEWAKWTAEALR